MNYRAFIVSVHQTDSVVIARSAGAAKRVVDISARECGYPTAFKTARCRRAPEYDGSTLDPNRPYDMSFIHEITNAP